MDAFWRSWAALEAQRQWPVYRQGPPPAVMLVELDPDHGVFVITFEGGEKFDLAPSGIAKPLRTR
jgi:hypothetical protein